MASRPIDQLPCLRFRLLQRDLGNRGSDYSVESKRELDKEILNENPKVSIEQPRKVGSIRNTCLVIGDPSMWTAMSLIIRTTPVLVSMQDGGAICLT